MSAVWDEVNQSLAVLYPNTPASLRDRIAAHAADEPAAWQADAKAWYGDQGLDLTDRSLEDAMKAYWSGTLWMPDDADVRITEDGQVRVTEDGLQARIVE